jgi:GMP synthase (glutamine-hydrolysing)
LFQDFGEGRIFQWHSDAFDLPAGAVHLAASRDCTHQAFRYGTTVYGFQFHLEVDEPLIERWLRVPVHCAELAAVRGQTGPEVIRHETALYLHRSRHLSDRVFGRFIDLFNLPPKRAALRSR